MMGPLEHFLQLTKIPRDSRDEKAIGEYLVSFAKERGLEAVMDEAFNVVIRKPGTAGYEKSPTLVIQNHSDMVYIKSADSNHDYHTPLVVKEDGKYLTAVGTSLGADNGIGMAYALALLDSKDIPHPPLEALFTSAEEVGMLGAARLSPDAVTGRRLINLDSEEEGVFTVGCAGGVAATFTLKPVWEAAPANAKSFKVEVKGLKGGHSGVEIDKGRGNAIQLLARVMQAAGTKLGAAIGAMDCGTKSNAIPNASEAIFVVNDEAALKNMVAEFDAMFKNELSGSDAGVTVMMTPVANCAKVLSKDTLEKTLLLIFMIPNGIQTMSMYLKGLVESSNNIGILKCKEDAISITCSIRSSINSLKQYIKMKVEMLAKVSGAVLSYEGDYPDWEYAPVSELRDKAVAAYKRLYGKEPRVEAIHGGLECGYFKSIHPDMDQISTGPNLFDVHTPEEKLDIASANRMWDWLTELVKELK